MADNFVDPQAANRAQALNSLNPVQRTFLAGLRGAEAFTNFHPTALRLYNDVVQRGRTSPITENDLSDQERAQFAALVQQRANATGEREGRVDYPHYGAYAPGLDHNILGGFRYAVGDNGNISISDTYDFNRSRGAASDSNQFLQALAGFVTPRNLAAQIGRQVVPDINGMGVPVNINLSPQGVGGLLGQSPGLLGP